MVKKKGPLAAAEILRRRQEQREVAAAAAVANGGDLQPQQRRSSFTPATKLPPTSLNVEDGSVSKSESPRVSSSPVIGEAGN